MQQYPQQPPEQQPAQPPMYGQQYPPQYWQQDLAKCFGGGGVG